MLSIKPRIWVRRANPGLFLVFWSLLWVSCGAGSEDELRGYLAKVHAYLHSSVDEEEYNDFIGKINNYFHLQQVEMSLVVKNIYSLSAFNPMVDMNRHGSDFAMLVGPGWGWFYGPPYYATGANTDLPFGFTPTGVHAEAHEVIHFLGVQDFYILDSESVENTPELLKDIMYDTYLEDTQITTYSKRIIDFNLEKMAQEGRAGIYYPKPELQHPEGIKTRFGATAQLELVMPSAGLSCSVFRMTYDFNQWKAGYESSPVVTADSDTAGVISFSTGFVGWYIGFKVECGSDVYYIPSPVLDQCFLRPPYSTVEFCRLACIERGKWCQVE